MTTTTLDGVTDISVIDMWAPIVPSREIMDYVAANLPEELLAWLDSDPARADDTAYVDAVYDQVEAAIQDGMDRLAKRRSLPVFG